MTGIVSETNLSIPFARARRKRDRPENAIQADIIRYLRAVLAPHDGFAYANANAARRTQSGKAANAVPGLTPGIPDLSIVTRGGRIYYLEVKTATGGTSAAQDEIIARLDAFGAPCVIVRSINDVKAALAHWNIRTREVTAQDHAPPAKGTSP